MTSAQSTPRRMAEWSTGGAIVLRSLTLASTSPISRFSDVGALSCSLHGKPRAMHCSRPKETGRFWWSSRLLELFKALLPSIGILQLLLSWHHSIVSTITFLRSWCTFLLHRFVYYLLERSSWAFLVPLPVSYPFSSYLPLTTTTRHFLNRHAYENTLGQRLPPNKLIKSPIA